MSESKKYNLSEMHANYGAIVLIDMPYENSENKLGDDIRILCYDESYISLTRLSGIVAGLKTSFEVQLMLLRVFLRPDIYEKVLEQFGENDIESFINEKLYELL